GWAPQMPADATLLFPDLFPTREAAKKAYQRANLVQHMGTSPYRYVSIRGCPHLLPYALRVGLRYQRRGARQRPRRAWIDPVKVPGPRAVPEAALGPLASFERLPETACLPPPNSVSVADPESCADCPPPPGGGLAVSGGLESA